MVNPKIQSKRNAPKATAAANAEKDHQGDAQRSQQAQGEDSKGRSLKKRLEIMSVPSLEAMLQDVVADRNFFDRIKVIQQLGDLLDQVKATMAYSRNAAFLPPDHMKRIITEMSNTGWIRKELVKHSRKRNAMRRTSSNDKVADQQQRLSSSGLNGQSSSLSGSRSHSSMKESHSASQLLHSAGYLSPPQSEKGKHILQECNRAIHELISTQEKSSMKVVVQRKELPIPIRTAYKPKVKTTPYKENRTSRLRNEFIHYVKTTSRPSSAFDGNRLQIDAGASRIPPESRSRPQTQQQRKRDVMHTTPSSKTKRRSHEDPKNITLREHLLQKEMRQVEILSIQLDEPVVTGNPFDPSNDEIDKGTENNSADAAAADGGDAGAADGGDAAAPMDAMNDVGGPFINGDRDFEDKDGEDDIESPESPSGEDIIVQNEDSRSTKSEERQQVLENRTSCHIFEEFEDDDDDDEDAETLIDEILKFRIRAELAICRSSIDSEIRTAESSPSILSSADELCHAVSSEYLQSIALLNQLQSSHEPKKVCTLRHSDSVISTASSQGSNDSERIEMRTSIPEIAAAQVETLPAEEIVKRPAATVNANTITEIVGEITPWKQENNEPTAVRPNSAASQQGKKDLIGFLSIVPNPIRPPEIYCDNFPAVGTDNVLCVQECAEGQEFEGDGDEEEPYEEINTETEHELLELKSEDLFVEPDKYSNVVISNQDDFNGNSIDILRSPDTDRELNTQYSASGNEQQNLGCPLEVEEQSLNSEPKFYATVYTTVVDYVHGLWTKRESANGSLRGCTVCSKKTMRR